MSDREIAAVLAAHRELSAVGYGAGPALLPQARSRAERREHFSRMRGWLARDVEGCSLAEAWLRVADRVKYPTLKAGMLAALIGPATAYVSRGAFIVATIHLDFPWRRSWPLDVLVGVSRRYATRVADLPARTGT